MRYLFLSVLGFFFYACHPVQRTKHRNELTRLKQIQQTVSDRLKILDAKNDSLFNAGFYSKAYSDSIGSDILKYQKKMIPQ